MKPLNLCRDNFFLGTNFFQIGMEVKDFKKAGYAPEILKHQQGSFLIQVDNKEQFWVDIKFRAKQAKPGGRINVLMVCPFCNRSVKTLYVSGIGPENMTDGRESRNMLCAKCIGMNYLSKKFKKNSFYINAYKPLCRMIEIERRLRHSHLPIPKKVLLQKEFFNLAKNVWMAELEILFCGDELLKAMLTRKQLVVDLHRTCNQMQNATEMLVNKTEEDPEKFIPHYQKVEPIFVDFKKKQRSLKSLDRKALKLKKNKIIRAYLDLSGLTGISPPALKKAYDNLFKGLFFIEQISSPERGKRGIVEGVGRRPP